MLYAFNQAGVCVERNDSLEVSLSEQEAIAAIIANQADLGHPGCTVINVTPDTWGNFAESSLKLVNGQIVNISAPTIYLHVDLTGGDGQDPIGIARAGSQWNTVHAVATLRQTADPASPIIPTGPAQAFRMRLVADQGGALIDLFTLTDGAGAKDLTVQTSDACGDYRLIESSLTPLGGYEIKLAKPVHVVVFQP